MAESDTEIAVPRGAFGLLADRSFGSFFAARLLTSVGIWLHSVVAAIAAYDATSSALIVGIVSFLQFIPQLLLAPLSGAWADRGNVKRQMILGRGLGAVGSIALAAWCVFAGDVEGANGAAAVAVSSFVVGVGLVIGGPAMQSGIPLLVSHEELPAAMALNTAPITIGRVAGPVLGAVTTAGFGYELAFLVAGVLHLLFIGLILRVTFPTLGNRPADDPRSIRDALAFVRSDRSVLVILAGVTALGFGSEPTLTLAPPLAEQLGGGASTVGMLVTSMGTGAAVGVVTTSIVASRIRHDVASVVGIVVMALTLGACAAPLSIHGAMAAFAFTGFGFIMSVSSLSTLMQMRLPAEMRGRVMALWLMGFVGARPIGALLVGTVADTSSVQVAFGCVAVTLLGAAVLCRPSQLREKLPHEIADAPSKESASDLR